MKRNDTQLGRPSVLYRDTQANIETLTGLVGGEIAYATDLGYYGVYNALTFTWVWGADQATALQILVEELNIRITQLEMLLELLLEERPSDIVSRQEAVSQIYETGE